MQFSENRSGYSDKPSFLSQSATPALAATAAARIEVSAAGLTAEVESQKNSFRGDVATCRGLNWYQSQI